MDSMTRRSRWAAIGLGIGLAVAGVVVVLELAGLGGRPWALPPVWSLARSLPPSTPR